MKKYSDYIINLHNLNNNVKVIKEKIGKKVKLCAMVKANAYNHGLNDVVKSIQDKVDFFGVANIFEAMQIRKINTITPVIIVGLINPKYANWCAKNNVSVTVDDCDFLKNAIIDFDYKLKVHLKVNTGLNRFGFNRIQDFKQTVSYILSREDMALEGVFTHFATKTEDIEFADKQLKIFKKYLKHINKKDLIIHCGNSFAAFSDSKYFFNMVRCGFALYGYYNHKDLKPALSITSKVIKIVDIKKGESVGYSRSFKATTNTTIAVVPLGYADGIDRRLSNVGCVLVNGEKAKIVGNICMDALFLNVSGIDNVRAGNLVTFLGISKDKNIKLSDYAEYLCTSEYDVLLKFRNARMNRVIINS